MADLYVKAPKLTIKHRRVLDAYFAKRIDTPQFKEGKTNVTAAEHKIVSGDTLSKLAQKYHTTVAKIKADNGLKNDTIILGNTLKIGSESQKEQVGNKVSFKRIDGANLGDEVYVIVETENLTDVELSINVKQGKTDTPELEEDHKGMFIVKQGNVYHSLAKATVGAYCNETNITNTDDFVDWAIFKITLGAGHTEQISKKLEKLTDKKAPLFLIVDGHTRNEGVEINYHGKNPNEPNSFINRWLDMDGKWFELTKGCDCGKDYDKQFKCYKYGSAHGPVYLGNEKLASYKFWNELIQNNRVTNEEKDILVGMSENEGNLDSVQSYDSEIFTAGAMQKTVNPQGKGEFTIQIKEFKQSNPDKYKTLFEDCGWTIDGDKLYYKDPKDSSATKITGSSLKTKIREGFTVSERGKKLKCKQLEPIVKAVKDKDFQAKQVEDFIDRLKNKVLPIKPSGYTYKIKDYLKSKLGKATALDHHINRPGNVKKDFGEALDNFFTLKDNEINEYNKGKEEKDHKEKISRNPNDWSSNHADYEKIILDDYGVNRRGTDMKNRYNKMKKKF